MHRQTVDKDRRCYHERRSREVLCRDPLQQFMQSCSIHVGTPGRSPVQDVHQPIIFLQRRHAGFTFSRTFIFCLFLLSGFQTRMILICFDQGQCFINQVVNLVKALFSCIPACCIPDLLLILRDRDSTDFFSLLHSSLSDCSKLRELGEFC